jgi:hypothetical protein
MAAISLPYSAAEALTQVRALIGEPTAQFWSDEELNNWVIEGSVDISVKALCFEHKNTFALVADQLEYTDFLAAPTTNGIAQVIKVYTCIYDDNSDGYTGLTRIHPRQIQHLTESTAGPSKYYYHFGGKIGIFPLPTATEAALTGPIIVYCSLVADAITDLPDHYQQFAVIYAAAMARLKERKNAEAIRLYTQYIQSMNVHRADIYERGVDAKSDFQMPDKTVVRQ